MPLNLDKLLIVKTDLSDFRDISPNIGEGRINPYIREAQTVEIRGFLGQALWTALEADYDFTLKTFTEITFTELWFGADYDDLDGNKIRFNGLMSAGIYFTYSRFLNQNQVNASAFGVESIQNEISEDVSNSQVRSKGREALQVAFSYQNDAHKFLTVKKLLYPLWVQAQDLKPRRTSFDFFKV